MIANPYTRQNCVSTIQKIKGKRIFLICVNVLLVLSDVMKMKIISNFIYYMMYPVFECSAHPLFSYFKTTQMMSWMVLAMETRVGNLHLKAN